jgi:hypothetical protein
MLQHATIVLIKLLLLLLVTLLCCQVRYVMCEEDSLESVMYSLDR